MGGWVEAPYFTVAAAGRASLLSGGGWLPEADETSQDSP